MAQPRVKELNPDPNIHGHTGVTDPPLYIPTHCTPSPKNYHFFSLISFSIYKKCIRMGKKRCNESDLKNNGEEKQNNKENKNGGKKDNVCLIVVVLKIELHCDGCASRVTKCIRSLEGVESVKGVDGDMNKLTVIGTVDPSKLREKIEQKTRKKVEIISPVPKKDKDKDNSHKENKKDGDGNQKKKSGDKPAKQTDEKKSKEPPVTTGVLKVPLHCEGCIQKIQKLVGKTKGYLEMSIDRQKELVTVKGAIDMKALAEALKEKLKKPVEIIPAKKDGGGDKNDGAGGKVAGDGGRDGGLKAEGNKMVQYGPQYEYGHPYVYGPGYMVTNVHAPQIFSDENPNACVVM